MIPRVSVLMTIYNPGRFLKPAVDSLLGQTFSDFELIALENGSNDGAKDTMRDYAASDARIRLIDLPDNIGRTPALNRAFVEARGEYVAVLDADDLAMPERLARQVEYLERNPTVVLLGSHVRYIDEQNNVIGSYEPPTRRQELRDQFTVLNPVQHSSAMFRRKEAADIGGYPPEYAFAQDFALWLSLAEHGEVAILNEKLVEIREHTARATLSPEFSLVRFRDSLDLFRRAEQLSGLSPTALGHGRTNRAALRYVFAGELRRARQPFSAFYQLVRSVVDAPIFCLRRARVKINRLGLFGNSSS